MWQWHMTFTQCHQKIDWGSPITQCSKGMLAPEPPHHTVEIQKVSASTLPSSSDSYSAMAGASSPDTALMLRSPGSSSDRWAFESESQSESQSVASTLTLTLVSFILLASATIATTWLKRRRIQRQLLFGMDKSTSIVSAREPLCAVAR